MSLPVELKFHEQLHNLSEELVALASVGSPMLYWSNIIVGWRCRLELNITALGGSLTVQTDSHPTPLAAVLECRDRTRTVVNQFKDK